ncbi:MAG TPA: hypothetical protein DHV62_06155 [Elusimicrobia bacterium]|jgi:anti-sigma factor RsiW|nr:hypothetical protein [Elusimicrobiota bacterium]
MECKKIRKRLSALIDGQLNLKEKEEILTHLHQCPGCKNEMEILKRTWDSLAVWQGIKTAENFEFKFWERIKVEEETKRFSLFEIFKRILPIPVPVVAGIIFLIGLLGGIYLNEKLQLGKIKSSSDTMLAVANFEEFPTESLEAAYISLTASENNHNGG